MPADCDPIVLGSGPDRDAMECGGPLPQDAGGVLLRLARAAIAAELKLDHAARDDLPWLKQHGACFITVMEGEKLRGCIGTLRPHRSLGEDVKANAIAAAFRDPRFKPLAAEEFAAVALEISVLSAIEQIAFTDEPDALRQLRAGLDGVVFEYGHHSSTFLPQVWDDFKEPTDFLTHLKYKAGLPPDFWDREVRLSRYTVAKWSEIVSIKDQLTAKAP
jgi:AmmeMemoRadiSam system protein A